MEGAGRSSGLLNFGMLMMLCGCPSSDSLRAENVIELL